MRILRLVTWIALAGAAAVQGPAGCATSSKSEHAAGAVEPAGFSSCRTPGEAAAPPAVPDHNAPAATAVVPAEAKAREFMITFDDGPCPESTAYILEQVSGMKKADGTPVKAGFFLIGQDKSRTSMDDIWQSKYGTSPEPGVTSYPDLVRRIAREGHFIGVHTQHHPDLSELEPADIEREILDCYHAILDTGVTVPKVFRSPHMHDPKSLPPALADWKIVRGELTKDYLPLTTEEHVADTCRKVIEAAGSPAILAFHDFRGLPGHRLDFRKIVNELVEQDHFVLADFDVAAAVAASEKQGPPKSRSLEDITDMTRIWRQRLSTTLAQ